MKTRAKMRVSSVMIDEHSDTVKMHAVYGGDKNSEDNTFAKATPSADLSMSVSNPALRGTFLPGQKFYVDFSPAE